MRILAASCVSAFVLLYVIPANAQKIAQKDGKDTLSVASCHVIKADSDRLKCYESLQSTVITETANSKEIKTDSVDEKIIVKFAGSSQNRTRPFHTDGPWELQWNTQKGYFSAILHRMGGEEVETEILANGMEAGSSSSFQPKGGDFYIDFGAMQPWSARVVALPKNIVPEKPIIEESSLLAVQGDQSDLPSCDGAGGSEEVKALVEQSPMGQTNHVSVLDVGVISARTVTGDMKICTASLMTNGGEMKYDFQYYRKDGKVYVFGRPARR